MGYVFSLVLEIFLDFWRGSQSLSGLPGAGRDRIGNEKLNKKTLKFDRELPLLNIAEHRQFKQDKTPIRDPKVWYSTTSPPPRTPDSLTGNLVGWEELPHPPPAIRHLGETLPGARPTTPFPPPPTMVKYSPPSLLLFFVSLNFSSLS